VGQTWSHGWTGISALGHLLDMTTEIFFMVGWIILFLRAAFKRAEILSPVDCGALVSLMKWYEFPGCEAVRYYEEEEGGNRSIWSHWQMGHGCRREDWQGRIFFFLFRNECTPPPGSKKCALIENNFRPITVLAFGQLLRAVNWTDMKIPHSREGSSRHSTCFVANKGCQQRLQEKRPASR